MGKEEGEEGGGVGGVGGMGGSCHLWRSDSALRHPPGDVAGSACHCKPNCVTAAKSVVRQLREPSDATHFASLVIILAELN